MAERSTFRGRPFLSIATAARSFAATSTSASMLIASQPSTRSARGLSRNWSAANVWNSYASSITAWQSTWLRRRSTRWAWTRKKICGAWKGFCAKGNLAKRLGCGLRLLIRPCLGCSDSLSDRRMRVKNAFDELRRLALRQVLIGQLLHRADEGGDGGNIFPRITVRFPFLA